MIEPVLLDRALCLPAPDITALLEGQNIVAIPKVAVQRGWTFALYPCDLLIDHLSVQQQYHSYTHTSAQAALASLNTSTVKIEAWARCELSTMIHTAEPLEVLSCSTVWTKAALQEALNQRQHIFLAYLKVYRLAEPVSVSANFVASDKRGKFVSLTSLVLENKLLTSVKVTEFLPVLAEAIFSQRKQQLEERKKPPCFELSKLVEVISLNTSTAAKEISQEARALLGWQASSKISHQPDPDLIWIGRIAEVGNSSEGNEFEKLVRKSLIRLGFSNSIPNPKASLDPEATGGAGGIDVCCREPYPLIGECKASKNQNVPTDVCSQLTYLGQTHFADEYDNSIKVIFAAGSLTSPANRVAVGNKMNVMRPETLQRLLEVKAKHAGAIDLLVLEPCLREAPFGEEADTKINRYIDKVLQDIKLRSQLVHIVKQLTQPDKKQLETAQICSAYNFTVFGLAHQSDWLDNQTVYELLIELSSPLTGYLGRLQTGNLSSDRFYYLRDLLIE
ncbi:DUF1802 family protein [Oculatella sp. LEGE 06141]|uniref:DUF1802 family protein n=1 Tax=Oculatella sp. LEGE 06141 TaxID=1828648 RepID=UPI001882CF74|nr:DUF1802 family protein [Oculatella sp. LEGE 06141]MBE9177783.1 DUF1802 family protein [Oculatella sp. LEGE 06141]